MDAEKARSVLTEERDRLRELGSWSREHEGAAHRGQTELGANRGGRDAAERGPGVRLLSRWFA